MEVIPPGNKLSERVSDDGEFEIGLPHLLANQITYFSGRHVIVIFAARRVFPSVSDDAGFRNIFIPGMRLLPISFGHAKRFIV
jgi:hypothetical protein